MLKNKSCIASTLARRWRAIALACVGGASLSGVCAEATVGAVGTGGTMPGVHSESPIQVQLTQRAVWANSPAASASSSAVPLQYVRPGNVVEYHARYTNTGPDAVRVQALLPVPAHTEYLANSARSSGNFTVHAAAGNGAFAAEPLQQSIVNGQHQTIHTLVPYVQYRAIRWQLGLLPPGKSEWVALRVRVAQETPSKLPLPVTTSTSTGTDKPGLKVP